MATQYQSIDPKLVAKNAKKPVPMMSSTQAPVLQSLEVKSQQPQAQSMNINPIGSSQPLPGVGLSTINKPIESAVSNFTPAPVQPVAQPTPQANNQADPVAKIAGVFKEMRMGTLTPDNLKDKYPELVGKEKQIVQAFKGYGDGSLTPDNIFTAYPELQGNQEPTGGGVKGQFSPGGIPQLDSLMKTTEGNYNPLKTIANLPTSTANVAVNLANMSLSPIDTVKTIIKSAVGGAGLLGEAIGSSINKEVYKQGKQELLQNDGMIGDLFRYIEGGKEGAKAIGDYFKGYGEPEELQRRVEEDPAGVISDVLSVAGLAGGTIAKAGKLGNMGKVAEVGQKIANIEKYDPYNLVPKGATQLANKSGVLGGVGKAVEGLVSPIASAKRSYNEVAPLLPGLKNNVAKRLLNSGIKITDTNKKAIIKSSGKEWTDFALENDIVGSVDDMIAKTDNVVDNSMQTKLKTLQDIKTTAPVTQTEKLVANSIITQAKNDIEALYGKPFDEIADVEKVAELQDVFDIVTNLQKTIDGGEISPAQMEALKSLYDAYNSHLKYDPAKSRILSGAEKIRLSLQKKIEDIGNTVGVDIKGLNKKIAGGYALKKGLIQAGNRMDNLNMFGLSDSQTAILSTVLGGSPLQVAGAIVGKGILESIPVKSRMAKSLYTKGLNEVPDNIPSNRPTASSNISRQFSSSNTVSSSNKTNDVKFPIKLSQEGLQTKGATLPKPTVKTPVSVREIGTAKNPGTTKGELPVPKKEVVPVKPKVDTMKNMTELDTNPQYQKQTLQETNYKRNVKWLQTEYGMIENVKYDSKYNPQEFTIDGVKYPANEVNNFWKKLGSDEAKAITLSNKNAEIRSKLQAIRNGKENKVSGPQLRIIMEDLGIKSIKDIPDESLQTILDMSRKQTVPKVTPQTTKNNAPTPKANVPKPKLGREILEGNLYHGGPEKITSFDISRAKEGNYGKGIYLTDNPKLAEYYGGLAIDNKALRDMPRGSLNFPDKQKGIVSEFDIPKGTKIKELKNPPSRKEIESLRNEGYDGVKFPDTLEKQDWSYELLGDYQEGNTVFIFNTDKFTKKPIPGK